MNNLSSKDSKSKNKNIKDIKVSELESTISKEKPVKVTKKVMTQVSIAEFMYKNIHMLGFENSTRVLNVAFRECMDNSLDACNDANIAPDIKIKLKKSLNKGFFDLVFEDNGPGVDPLEAPNICCRLLYGDKFRNFDIMRGQQGLGLTALILYAQKTSNKPVTITVKRPIDDLAHIFTLKIDIKNNRPIVISHKTENIEAFNSGFIVSLTLSANYIKKGAHSPIELLNHYLYLNPNMSLTFEDFEGIVIQKNRVTTEGPVKNKAVKQIPLYQELGDFAWLLKKDSDKVCLPITQALKDNFEITDAEIKSALDLIHLSEKIKANALSEDLIVLLRQALIKVTKNKQPSLEYSMKTDPNLITVVTKGNNKEFDEVIETSAPARYFKHGISRVVMYGFYGGSTLSEDGKVELIRVANNSPLIYQAGSCVITKTIMQHNWKALGFSQNAHEMPKGKLILIVHVNATKVPFLSESKDAIAEEPVIKDQINYCLNKLSARIRTYLRQVDLHRVRQEKCQVITNILPDMYASLKTGLNLKFDNLIEDQFIGTDSTTKSDLSLLSKIMDAPCLFLHKDVDHMVAFNPTVKSFKLLMIDKVSKAEILNLAVPGNSHLVLAQKYDPKKHLMKGVSHVQYHVFQNAEVKNYSLSE